jgi:nitric oxide synthase oxygenase domain/subunit
VDFLEVKILCHGGRNVYRAAIRNCVRYVKRMFYRSLELFKGREMQTSVFKIPELPHHEGQDP